MKSNLSQFPWVLPTLLAGVTLWLLEDVVFVAIGACIVAVGLNSLAVALAHRLPLQRHHALLIVVLLILIALGGAAIGFGTQIRGEFAILVDKLPQAWARFNDLTDGVLALLKPEDIKISELGGRFAGGVMRAGGAVMSALSNVVLVLVAGVFLAWDPALYRRGVIALTPSELRDDVADVLDKTAHSWTLWLAATLIAMAIVALLVSAGTWLIGLPAPLALGTIAGLVEFVPIIGSVGGSIPALLVAMGTGGNAVLWTILLVVAVQQLESSVVSPLLLQQIVSLPPAAVILSIVTGGSLFGLQGVFFAVPTAIFLQIVIVTFYIRKMPGGDGEAAPPEAS